MSPSLKVLLSASACAASLFAGVQARAAQTSSTTAAQPGTEVGELVVTAQKREQSVQDIPAAIAAISGAALDQRGISGVNDLQFWQH